MKKNIAKGKFCCRCFARTISGMFQATSTFLTRSSRAQGPARVAPDLGLLGLRPQLPLSHWRLWDRVCGKDPYILLRTPGPAACTQRARCGVPRAGSAGSGLELRQRPTFRIALRRPRAYLTSGQRFGHNGACGTGGATLTLRPGTACAPLAGICSPSVPGEVSEGLFPASEECGQPEEGRRQVLLGAGKTV